ncbi:uncharacterized protein LOC134261603 [Saccostrea cucullata]|uniref:uncharacterized protein LOC134261603 n=1 Tax=Saccostrea cuccullata TaxID=36930 RepID=UPI002ED04BCD
MKEGKIFFYNPCGERPTEMKKIERRWMKYIEDVEVACGVQFPLRNWSVTNIAHTRQRDSFNCGIYCLIFAEKHLTNKLSDLQSITDNELQEMRRSVAEHIMLYEVYLTECCLKCGGQIGNDEFVTCKTCRRPFHFLSFCIEEDLKTLNDSDEFECRLCKIDWGGPQKIKFVLFFKETHA